MDKKENYQTEHEEEKVLDFETAKDLTIAEAVKKHKEIQAGVTEDDGLLDRYIKQHREEIESQKFETQQLELPIEAEEAVETIVEEVEQEAEEELTLPEAQELTDEEMLLAAQALGVEETELPDPETADFNDYDDFEAEAAAADTKKKIIFWSGIATLFVGTLAAGFVWLNAANQSNSTASSSSSSSSQTSSSSSSSSDANLTAFNQLYATFFTDSSLTKLKNSEFGKLAELKTLLDKLDTSSDAYKEAKTKYDNLEKAIQAIQALNSQFDQEVIVNGEVNTNATVKAGQALSAVATGISGVDSTIAAAVNFGASQQTATSVADTSTATTTTSQSSSETVTSDATATTSSAVTTGSLYGIEVPAGVTLQRSVSRVTYNQSAIDDATNPAWVFGDGILENIIAISQQRGYISGNNYILEKVNIVNGNGYYNLFKPDGTYLFTINCKTGYFVGNGSGYSDDLDF